MTGTVTGTRRPHVREWLSVNDKRTIKAELCPERRKMRAVAKDPTGFALKMRHYHTLLRLTAVIALH